MNYTYACAVHFYGVLKVKNAWTKSVRYVTEYTIVTLLFPNHRQQTDVSIARACIQIEFRSASVMPPYSCV